MRLFLWDVNYIITLANDREEGIKMRPGRFPVLDELREANEHCLHVGGYKDATGFRRQPQYFGIWGTIRNHAHVAYKVDAGLPSAETAPDVGIEIRIGLERYL